MDKAPKSLRLQIGIFGRTNVGKSSLLNMLAGQDVSITSPVAGTTTDVVEKTMELLPLGPIVFLDTAGLDDVSVLGEKRRERTLRALDRSDIAVLVVEPDIWGVAEQDCLLCLKERKKPFIIVVNKADLGVGSEVFRQHLLEQTARVLFVSSCAGAERNQYLDLLKKELKALCPADFLAPPALLGDLLPSGGLVVMVVPIDLQAPKGRLILPQVQAIRDALDNDMAAVVVKEREYAPLLRKFIHVPDLVVCDSQVVMKVVADTPASVKCTTFSVLLARMKGDLIALARGAAYIERLVPGDKVLIAESCSHHAAEDDIGRVKIPRWLKQVVGGDVQVEHYAGRDYPEHLERFKLIIHCGSCMLTRGEMLLRIQKAQEQGVPVTNYGLAISLVQGVLLRVLAPFPAALDAFMSEKKRLISRRCVESEAKQGDENVR